MGLATATVRAECMHTPVLQMLAALAVQKNIKHGAAPACA